MSATLRSYVAKKAKEESEVFNARVRARDLHRGAHRGVGVVGFFYYVWQAFTMACHDGQGAGLSADAAAAADEAAAAGGLPGRGRGRGRQRAADPAPRN